VSDASPAPGPARPVDLLGVGECSLDHVLRVTALPPAGGKAQVSQWHDRPGGQVATATLAAARLGLGAAYGGAVGDDGAAEVALAPLGAAGVDLSRVVRVAGARTRTAVIVVDASGERVVFGHRDAGLTAASPALGAVSLAGVRLLLLDASDPEAALALAARTRGQDIAVLLDLDTPSDAAERLLGLAEFPVVSEGFATRAFGSAEAALRAMAQLGARLAVVTRGAEGAVALGPSGRIDVAPPRVGVLDTTGAGDVFRGALAWALLGGLTAEAAIRHACAAAALSCEGHGAQGALPGPDAVRSAVARAYGAA
jgi:sulfofructose kinase